MIVQYFQSEIHNIRSEVISHTEADPTFELLLKMNVIYGADSFIRSFDWAPRGFSRIKYAAFLNGMKPEEIAVHFNQPVEDIYAVVNRADKLISLHLGTVMGFLLSNEVERACREFRLRTGRGAASLFPAFIYMKIKASEHSEGTLTNCESELAYLSTFVQSHAIEKLSSLDRRKMEHLLFVLSTDDARNATVRSIIFRCLEGELEVKEAVTRIQQHYNSLEPELLDEY